MQFDLSRYRVKLAEEDVEREGAHRLRYRVFVEEMGARPAVQRGRALAAGERSDTGTDRKSRAVLFGQQG